MNKEILIDTKPEKAPLIAKVGLVGGAAVALASGLFLDHHEVQTSEEAVFSITTPFSNETLTHIDEPEVVVGALGVGGLVVSLLGAEEIRAARRRR